MIKAFLALMIFAIVSEVQAQENPGNSLDEAVSIALRQNPEVLVAQRQIELVKGRRGQVSAPERPEFALKWEKVPPGGSLNRAGDRIVEFGQNLDFPIKLLLKRSAVTADVDAAVEDLERTKILIAARVKKAYYRVWFQQKIAESLELSSGLLEQFQQTTLSKYQSGELAYFEVLRARVEGARAKNEIIETRAELASAQTDFNLILGRPGTEEFTLSEAPVFVPFVKSKDSTVKEFLQASRTLKIARLAKERENRGLSLARWDWVPDLRFSGGVQSGDGGPFFPNVGVGVSIPLWWWGTKGKITESRAALQLAELQEQALSRGLTAEIERRYQLVKAAEEQMILFEKNLLPDADEELKAGIDAYQYNQIDALNLLDIYRTAKGAKLEYYRAFLNYLAALADLETSGEEK